MTGNRHSLAPIAIFAVAASALLHSDAVDAAPKKITGSGGSIAIIAESRSFPDDQEGHELGMETQREVDRSSDPNFEVVHVVATGMHDYVNGNGRHWGYRTGMVPSGEKVFMSYEGTTKTTMQEGTPNTTFEGRWRYTGGTGKFAGISGSGTYKGRILPDGSSEYTFEGEYETR